MNGALIVSVRLGYRLTCSRLSRLGLDVTFSEFNGCLSISAAALTFAIVAAVVLLSLTVGDFMVTGDAQLRRSRENGKLRKNGCDQKNSLFSQRLLSFI